MHTRIRLLETLLILAVAVSVIMIAAPAGAQLERDADAALKALYKSVPVAKKLGEEAKGVLVFPRIRKAGFLVGAQYGEGVLLKNGQSAGHYSMTAASYGLQAGVQEFAYAMFFMQDAALKYLDNSAGFEVGVGPSVVVMDSGKAKTLTTTTQRDDVYAFVFGQKGLMAGAGLQGSKITKTGQ
jgi:lipid-binding SYLF domain-containing protein